MPNAYTDMSPSEIIPVPKRRRDRSVVTTVLQLGYRAPDGEKLLALPMRETVEVNIVMDRAGNIVAMVEA